MTPAPSPARALPAPGAPRALVVEDNAVNQLVAERALADRGLAVDVAADGREALAMLAEGAYAVVLMDCQMPHLDGYETTAAVRSREAAESLARTPIVAMTANALHGDRERCLAAGMDDYLAKPLRGDELDAVLARVLGDRVAATDAAVPLVDAARLRSFRDDHPDVAGRLADLFAQTTPETLDELRDALARGDAEAVRRGAHKLGGSCQNVGATFMATLCRSLEAGDGEATLAELDAAFARTEVAVRSLLSP
jgi:CheY-like chemotaxis protein